ncbi:MAG: CapA family protein [Planctomycetota bacterium]|nr:CapA family protein [Planctomycetota bacterium]
MIETINDTTRDDLQSAAPDDSWRSRLLQRVPPESIPETEDILIGKDLDEILSRRDEPRLSLLAAGDIMLGDRMRAPMAMHGADYPFDGVLPLLRRADIVFGNLEGPLARRATKADRTFSYRVRPESAASLSRAGINAVTLANNHLLDCGREGVLETLDALATANIAPVGAGRDRASAHQPAILQAGDLRVGLLAYYWNRRCAASDELPGSALDSVAELAADIGGLRERVDRIAVAFHWGVPYEREPADDVRVKARLAVDLGADAVIGHHPHVVQAFEIHRGRPIFYSVGNFAFGSGNSRGEGLLAGFRFESDLTFVYVYPIHVMNRDPRINYQPKVLRGDAASARLGSLQALSAAHGAALRLEDERGVIELTPEARDDS